jgi:hypothetical protein
MQRPVLQSRPSVVSRQRHWRPSQPHVRAPGQSERERVARRNVLHQPPRPPSVFVHASFPRRDRNYPAAPGAALSL